MADESYERLSSPLQEANDIAHAQATGEYQKFRLWYKVDQSSTKTMYTVPAGKVLYISEIIVYHNNAQVPGIYDASGTTKKIGLATIASYEPVKYTFDPPLVFKTSIYADNMGAAGNYCNWLFKGYMI